MEVTILDLNIGRAGQVLQAKQLMDIAGARFLADVYMDSYVSQSSAVINRWDGQLWQRVYALNLEELVFHKQPGRKAVDHERTATVLIARLVQVAILIVKPADCEES